MSLADAGPGAVTVGALVPYPPDTTPSQRFRIEQWMPYLAEQGIRVDLIPFADERLIALLPQPGRLVGKAAALSAALLRSAARIGAMRRYDVVLIHRAICIVGPAILERAVALLGRPVIFDFDDAIYRLHTARVNRAFGWLKFPGKTATICRLSDHVVVGNGYLAEYARRFNQRVTVVPTGVDTERYRPVQRTRASGRFVIGWTGSSTSQTYLEWFAPVLAPILADLNVELHVVSDRRPQMDGVPLVWKRWSRETEVADVEQFDIGLMPMPDEEWALGKCALKALLYMAVGIPAVCSAVGANCDVIRHGENGFLASSPDEWRSALRRLTEDAALRRRLGAAARATVEESFAMTGSAARFAGVVHEVLRQSRSAARKTADRAAGERPEAVIA